MDSSFAGITRLGHRHTRPPASNQWPRNKVRTWFAAPCSPFLRCCFEPPALRAPVR